MSGEPAPQRVAPPARSPELRWRRVFPGEERQLGILRRWVASLLPECPARDDVTCVASELGANAIRHTASGRGGWFAAEITWHATVVRVTIADSGAPSGPRLVDDPASENGRGLIVVRGLSVRSGVCGDHRGRLLWADIPWAGPASPLPAQDPYETAIHAAEASLARQFDGTPAWFGRSTLQWWALTGRRGLVSAPAAHGLATRLGAMASSPGPAPSRGPSGSAARDPGWRQARRATRAAMPTPPDRRRGIDWMARGPRSASPGVAVRPQPQPR